MWEVVIWINPSTCYCSQHSTKDNAYKWATDAGLNIHAIEVYGPDDYYDGAQ